MNPEAATTCGQIEHFAAHLLSGPDEQMGLFVLWTKEGDDMTREFLTVKETATYLHLGEHHVRSLVDAGELDGYVLPASGQRRIRAKSLETFAKRHSARP